jgi:muramoyltetrapeptide carboxypeptidase
VALVAPAGPVDDQAIRTATRRCRDLGFVPVPGDSVTRRLGYLAGTDEERAADLQAAIGGDATAIWALRGGYGTLRTLRHVDLEPLAHQPKAFIGFSDNTIVHLALRRLGLVSFHGPHAGYRHFPDVTASVFRSVVMSDRPAGVLPLPDGVRPRTLVPGTAEGPLVGGNLAMLGAACGTPYQPDTRGAILFLEDVDEAPYRVDRLLVQLRLAGLLDGVAGVALGDFTPPADVNGSPDGPTADDVLLELLAPLGVPIVAGLPFGHGEENWTLPVGVRARLDGGSSSLEILEPSTASEGQ